LKELILLQRQNLLDALRWLAPGSVLLRREFLGDGVRQK